MKIYPQANRQKGTLKVEVKLTKTDEYLRPDISIRINFLAEPIKNNDGAPRVVVPKTAIHGTGEQRFVWVVRNQHVVKIPVRMGTDFGDTFQVQNGLDGGEALVLSGPENLPDGMPVRVAEKSL